MQGEMKKQVPTFDKMIRPVVQALHELGGSAQREALDKKTISLMELSEAVQRVPHKEAGSDRRTEVEYRLAWARTYLKKYGLVENPERGTWVLTKTFDGNMDGIDPDLIVRTVRNANLTDFKRADVSVAESRSAFARFATSILRDQAEIEGKPFREDLLYKGMIYDAVFPEGLGRDSRVTCVEIWNHLNIDASDLYINCVTDNLQEDDCFLLILGESLSDAEKRERTALLQGQMSCNCMLWDYNDLMGQAVREPDYIEYLETPKKALAEDAIRRVPDAAEQQRVQEQRIEALKKAYRDQNITLCLGAGVSTDAGIPLWSDLIQKLLICMIGNKTQEESLNEQELERLNQIAYCNREDSLLTQVRYIHTAFETEEYYDLVRKVLYEKESNLNTGLLNAISSISKPERDHVGVKAVITYNFDDLLERKLASKEIKYRVIYREKDVPSTNALNIYHVHGFLPQDPEKRVDDTTLIFSEEDYHEVYRDAYCWSNITQLNAFRDTTCLFVGCSLTDPNLRRLLDIPARSGEGPRHFAIMRRKKFKAPDTAKTSERLLALYQRIDHNIREESYRKLGIQVIWVDDFQEIPQLLMGLLGN